MKPRRITLILFFLPVFLFGQQVERPRWEISAQSVFGIGRQFIYSSGEDVVQHPEFAYSYGGDVTFYPLSTGIIQCGISVGAHHLSTLQYIHEDSSIHSYCAAWGFPLALKGKCNFDSISMWGMSPFVCLSAGYLFAFNKKYPLYDEQNTKHAMYGYFLIPELGVRSGALFLAAGVWLQSMRQGVAEPFDPGLIGGNGRVKRLNPFHLAPAFSIRLGIQF